MFTNAAEEVETEVVAVKTDSTIVMTTAGNLIECLHLHSQLIEQVYESMLLTRLYHRHANLINFSSTNTVILPKNHPNFSLDPSCFHLAAREVEDALPMNLELLGLAENFLRLDPVILRQSSKVTSLHQPS